MIDVDVVWTAQEVTGERVAGQTAVIIDVLRATTMTATLLHRGARRVLPVKDVEDAEALASALGADALLAGERGGLPPEGFDLGNSPVEATRDKVQDRSVVLTTTNGTLAVHRSLKAQQIVAAAFVNAQAVIRWLAREKPARIFIVCAGTVGRFSMDDALCAGLLVERLTTSDDALVGGKNVELTDSALAARALYRHHAATLAEAVRSCQHGRNLTRLGLYKDIDWATQVDALDVVPVLFKGPSGYQFMSER